MPEVDVRIKTTEQGSAGVQRYGTALDGMVGKALKVGAALGGVGLAFAGIERAAGAAWSALEQGAALELAQSRFDNLAASIDTTSDALMSDMGAASQGMMSNAQMIASASEIISLGLGDSGDEVTRLSNLVGQLGWDMQVLTLTLANDSKMRLDALGLSVQDVTARMEDLKAAGVGADEAFDLAVIEAGEAKLELLGSAADSSAGKMKVLEAQWANVVDTFKQEFASGVVDQLENITGAIQGNAPGFEEGAGELGRKAGNALGVALNVAASIGLDSLNRRISDSIGLSIQEVDDLYEQIADEQGMGLYIDTDEDLRLAHLVNETLRERYGLLIDFVDAAENARSEWDDWGSQIGATTELGQAYEHLIDQYNRWQKLQDGSRDSGVGAAIQWRDALSDVAAQIAGQKDGWERSAAAADAYGSALEGLSGLARANLDEARAAADELAKVYEEAGIRMGQAFSNALQPDAMPDFGNMEDMNARAWDIAQAFGLTVEQVGNVGIALGEITPEMAEAATKAVLFQEAFGVLLGQFQAGNLDTSGFVAAYEALISDLQSKSLVEIQVELKQKENPARELWAWLPAEERQAVEIPVTFTPEESALNTVLGQIDGIPDEQSKVIVFDADASAVVGADGGGGAVYEIESAIAEIDTGVEFKPETAAVNSAITQLRNTLITVPVTFVPTNSGSVTGGGGVVGGGQRIGGRGLNVNMSVAFNGTAEPRAVQSALTRGLHEFYADLAREGVMD